jgi:hypothetical protein
MPSERIDADGGLAIPLQKRATSVRAPGRGDFATMTPSTMDRMEEPPQGPSPEAARRQRLIPIVVGVVGLCSVILVAAAVRRGLPKASATPATASSASVISVPAPGLSLPLPRVAETVAPAATADVAQAHAPLGAPAEAASPPPPAAAEATALPSAADATRVQAPRVPLPTTRRPDQPTTPGHLGAMTTKRLPFNGPAPAAPPPTSKAAAACKLVKTLDKEGEAHFSCPCAVCQ